MSCDHSFAGNELRNITVMNCLFIWVLISSPFSAYGGQKSFEVCGGGFFPTGAEAKRIDPSPHFGLSFIDQIRPQWSFKFDLAFTPAFDGVPSNQIYVTAIAGWMYFPCETEKKHPYVGFGGGLTRFSSSDLYDVYWYWSSWKPNRSYTAVSIAGDVGVTTQIYRNIGLDVRLRGLYNIALQDNISDTFQIMFTTGFVLMK